MCEHAKVTGSPISILVEMRGGQSSNRFEQENEQFVKFFELLSADLLDQLFMQVIVKEVPDVSYAIHDGRCTSKKSTDNPTMQHRSSSSELHPIRHGAFEVHLIQNVWQADFDCP